MAPISRVRVALSGFTGGPGVSTFYCLEPAPFLDQLRAFYANLVASLPDRVHVKVEPIGDIIDSVNGKLTGSWSAAPVADVVGAYQGAYSAPSGFVVNWLTGSVLDGHRLRGRTFIVPIGADSFDVDGTIRDDRLVGYNSAAAQLVTAAAANFVVWHRNRPPEHPKGERAGGHDVVTSSIVHDKAAILRSRRD